MQLLVTKLEGLEGSPIIEADLAGDLLLFAFFDLLPVLDGVDEHNALDIGDFLKIYQSIGVAVCVLNVASEIGAVGVGCEKGTHTTGSTGSQNIHLNTVIRTLQYRISVLLQSVLSEHCPMPGAGVITDEQGMLIGTLGLSRGHEILLNGRGTDDTRHRPTVLQLHLRPFDIVTKVVVRVYQPIGGKQRNLQAGNNAENAIGDVRDIQTGAKLRVANRPRTPDNIIAQGLDRLEIVRGVVSAFDAI